MKVRRDIASIPLRSATETWLQICQLIQNASSIDTGQLEAGSSSMADVIAEYHPNKSPIIVTGCGPQLRIYLDYDESAVDRGTVIDAINWCPTECSDWAIHVPADTEDLEWLNEIFKNRAPRLVAYDKSKGYGEIKENSSVENRDLEIDWQQVGIS